ncbi:MAG: phosphoribosylaminoimidazolesuccinocarboxamide synthase [Candidatus Bathyarchaeota archaeon]|jgi:phosphoribosylaminoimidazole-succinocarboxamide synthase|nr:phosphoribosylaminoimidazolesuccinocarboxamide synthase [Candidatus Bathyarchaeota archaeon A05DMB-5]MDH7558202.1 phosphoribosylaminoimidazolesuccinocarboxamide synthase [Candidatus Bathyarchaeota archaeon]
MGSVKDLEVVKKPTKDVMGVGRFHFSDRYSVFDWGEMPDLIDGKGAALCMMGAYCFEKLEEKGIRTHYRGLVDKSGKVVRFDELEEPSSIMEINLVNVYKPRAYVENGKLKYDYSLYTSALRNFLIPLEIIYRNGLPEGSSVFKRLEKGLVTFEELGLDHYPKAGERLAKPIFDVSTKLEEGDRYVSWSEALRIAGLTDRELVEVKDLLLRVDETITEIAAPAGLVNEDGKIELAFDPQRRLMVVDVVGTLDECRFTYNGLHVSKEIARIYYRGTEWAREVEEAKKRAVAEGVKDWKRLVKSKPPRLDSTLKNIIKQMYMAAANEVTKKKIFDVPKLAEIVKEYEKRQPPKGD